MPLARAMAPSACVTQRRIAIVKHGVKIRCHVSAGSLNTPLCHTDGFWSGIFLQWEEHTVCHPASMMRACDVHPTPTTPLRKHDTQYQANYLYNYLF